MTSSTVTLSFSKEEPEKLESAITIVKTFLECLPKQSSKITFDQQGDHPKITIHRQNQILECKFHWCRGKTEEFNADSCKFSFHTKNIDDLIFDFAFPSSGSSSWIVHNNQEIQELIKTMVEYIQKTGRSKLFPTDFLN